MKKISATRAARNFSDIVNRVRFGRESFTVTRNGEPMCRIEPVDPAVRSTVSDLFDFLETVSWPDPDFANDLTDVQKAQPEFPVSPWDS